MARAGMVQWWTDTCHWLPVEFGQFVCVSDISNRNR